MASDPVTCVAGDPVTGEDRSERAARTAGELLELTVGSKDGDLDRALRHVRPDDSYSVLAAVLRQLALPTAPQQLRAVEPAERRRARWRSSRPWLVQGG